MTSAFPIKRLASVTLGKMVQPDSKAASNIYAPYLRAAHVQPQGQVIELPDQRMWFSRLELSALDLRQGDVVVVEGGAGYGRSAVLHDDLPGWGFQNSIVRLRPAAGVADGRFLDYALQDALTDGRIDLVTSTATLPHFTADKVSKFEVPSPPLDEQRAIADYLDQETAQIDALVTKQEEFIGLLRERRSAEISHAVQAAPSRVKLKYVAGAGQYGLNFSASEYVNAGTRLLRTTDLVGGRMTPSSDGIFVPEQAVSERDRLASGDLLLSRSGTVGRGFVVPPEAEGMTFAGFLVRFRPKPDMDGRYLGYCTQTAEFQRVVQSEAVSSTIQNFNADRYGNVDIPMLPIDAQLRVVNRLDEQTAQIDALISKAWEHIALAKERRAALITAAVTGQLDVRTSRKAG